MLDPKPRNIFFLTIRAIFFNKLKKTASFTFDDSAQSGKIKSIKKLT